MKLIKGFLSFFSIPAMHRWRLKKNAPEQRTFSKIDYYRLQNILSHEHDPAYQPHLKQMTRLRGILLRGRLCPCKEVSADLVTMNSVLSIESKRGTRFTITLVYPWEANPKERKYSVLSPIGMDLIGKWRGERFLKGMRIADILYQPESAGKYYV